ncbi:transcriptional regulator [Escherichia coli]|nr:PerC family transcriptional regulator [Escherichia coli]CTY37137.1 transcriptional regulator [Escherichia coli]HAX7850170.1 PerC family transcriptional regulator [Escherichia coli]
MDCSLTIVEFYFEFTGFILSLHIHYPVQVQDPVAQKLEEAGLWRRAATRWLTVMGDVEYTEAQREWIRQRREYCLMQLPPQMLPEKLDVSEVARAADATLLRMGGTK